MKHIVQKDNITSAELLELTGKKHNEWSEPRKRLIEKGILDGSIRGRIVLRLPRFKEYVQHQIAWENA